MGFETTHIYAPALAEAIDSHTINITGEVIDTEGYLIVSDFVAAAVNNATGKHVLSNTFNSGQFVMQLNVPDFAEDNQTIDIQVLSLDGSVVYGNASLRLVNLNHTSAYPVTVSVANPPPNYNWLLIILLILGFSLVLSGYILFTKWLIRQTVLKRANEIMIQRNLGEAKTDDTPSDDDEINESDEN